MCLITKSSALCIRHKYDISLVALDGWQHSTHHANTRAVTHTAHSYIDRRLRVGEIETNVVGANKFLQSCKGLLYKAKSSKDPLSQRHEKTPGFILSLIKHTIGTIESIDKVQEDGILVDFTPDFGFTDVGQHKAIQPRDTTWKLVLSVFFI